MQYKCIAQSLSKVLFKSGQAVCSLCNNCESKDCTNQIENKKVSILGVSKKMRVLVGSDDIFAIVDCEGYVT